MSSEKLKISMQNGYGDAVLKVKLKKVGEVREICTSKNWLVKNK